MIKPSNFHNNRRWHNWIVYDINDKFLQKYSKYLKGHLVDLGCGDAPYKKYFLQFVDKYTGVDWSNTLHNSKIDIYSDLNVELDLEDEVADSIISLSVLEHLFEPQVFLNESFRILKKDGRMLLQVPWQWRLHEIPHDYFRYTPNALKHMFAKAGFNVIGLDIDDSKINKLNNKKSYISYISDSVIEELFQSNFIGSSDYSLVSESDVVIFCVPTPLSKN